MTTWILILTITTYRGDAITAVHGLQSRAACVAAGDAWLKDVQSGYGMGYEAAHATCVPDRL